MDEVSINDIVRRLEIEEFPGYWVFEDGSVWSDPKGINTSGRFLRPSIDRDGYHQYRMVRGGKQYCRKAHRLVLEAFVGPCPEGMECRHLDGNPQNNHVSNLCWGTVSENHRDKKRHGTDSSGERNGMAKLTWDDVSEIRRLLESGEYSQREIARMFGVSPALVTHIKKCEVWSE
jgi:hypothetical protein